MSQAGSRDAKKQASRPRAARAIVEPNPLAALKRRAEDLGLIVHARPSASIERERRQKGGRKK